MVVGAVTRRQCAQLNRRTRSHPGFNVRYPTGLGKNTHRGVFHWGADKCEFSGIECDSGRLEKLRQEQTTDEMTDRKAVRLGNFVQVVSGNQTTRADHVFNDDRWITWNVLWQVPGKSARVNIESASRGKPH